MTNEGTGTEIRRAMDAAASEFAELVTRLQERVAQIADTTRPKHWGHVGDLTHINSELRDLLRFARA